MVKVTTSNYLAILESRIIADLCEKHFFIDVADSVYIAGNGMLGGNIKIVNPYGVTIKNYPAAPDYDIDGSNMSEVQMFDIPTEAGTLMYGDYTFIILVEDIDGHTYEISKTISICEPDVNRPDLDYGVMYASLTGLCKDGKLMVSISQPPVYKGKMATSRTLSGTLEYPTSSGIADLAFTVPNFSVQLFEGVYKIEANICALYNFGDNLFVKVPYEVKTRKEVFCSIDFCCVFEKLSELNIKLSKDCTDEERETTSNKILEALMLMEVAQLAAGCGKDPSEYIEQLQELLNCRCGGCDCPDGTPIINNDPCLDFVIEGCNVSKSTNGLTTTYTIDNYEYLLEVEPNGGVLTMSAPVLDGCTKKQTLVFDPTKLSNANNCNYYLDPATDEAWATPQAADAGIPAGCKSHGYRFLSYDALGNEQIYWYVNDGSGGLIIDLHLDYQSTGTGASRRGSLENEAPRRDSMSDGYSAYIGTRHDVSAFVRNSPTVGKTKLTIDAALATGTRIGIVKFNSSSTGEFQWKGEVEDYELVGGTDHVITIDALLLAGTDPAEWFIVDLSVDNDLYGNIAMGTCVIAEGEGAVAIGVEGYSKGANSFGFGYRFRAVGNSCVALSLSQVNGNKAFGMGENEVNGNGAFGAGGSYNIIDGDDSHGWGRYNQTDGDMCGVGGQSARAFHNSSWMLGMGKMKRNGSYEKGAAQVGFEQIGTITTDDTPQNLTLDIVTSSSSPTDGDIQSGDELKLEGDSVTVEGTLQVQQEKTVLVPTVVASKYRIRGEYVRGVGLVDVVVECVYNGLNLGNAHSFNGATAVDPSTNQITIVAHGLAVDQPVFYDNGGGTTIVGMRNKTTYYVKQVVDADNITLSRSVGGAVVDITADGVGASHKLYEMPFSISVFTDVSEDYLRMPVTGLAGTRIKWYFAPAVSHLISKATT